jgi:GntR family transcriptional regulator
VVDVTLRVDGASGVPPYMQIAEQVRQAIGAGVLRPGDRLPTVKDIVAMVAVNPNTVARAYRELDQDGYIVSQRGVGTFPAEDRERATAVADKQRALRTIFDRAVAEAARSGIPASDVIRYFQKVRP